MKFRQIYSDEWIKGDYRIFAEINVKSSRIAEKFSVIFEDGFEEGLGESKRATFVTDTGTQFFIEDFLPNSKRCISEVGLLSNEETLAANLDEILEVLELTSKNLSWYHEKIKLQPYELWRQDDNGHKFLIETFACKADAVKAMKNFEAKHHKQTYWLEKSTANKN